MKVRNEGPGLVSVISGSEDVPKVEESEYPIILTAREWELLQNRRYKLCMHRWEYRTARPVGQFKIVSNNEVRVLNLPSGRVCSKCGKIEWVADKEKAVEPWKQTDFTPEP